MIVTFFNGSLIVACLGKSTLLLPGICKICHNNFESGWAQSGNMVAGKSGNFIFKIEWEPRCVVRGLVYH